MTAAEKFCIMLKGYVTFNRGFAPEQNDWNKIVEELEKVDQPTEVKHVYQPQTTALYRDCGHGNPMGDR